MVGTNGRTFEAQNPEDSPVNQGNYAGVDPIYQNAANKTDEPHTSEEDDKAAAERGTKVSDKPNEVQPADAALGGTKSEDKADDEEEKEEDKGEETKPETPATPAPATQSAKSTSTKK